MSEPLWRNPDASAKKRVAHYLYDEVGEGGKVSVEKVRRDISGPGLTQIDRRMRELREVGWEILSYKDMPALQPDEHFLKKVGDRIWEDGYRWPTKRLTPATRRQVFDRDGQACAICGITFGTEYPDVPGTIARPMVGHIVPLQHGGTDELENLRAVCHLCNSTGAPAGPDPERVDALAREVEQLEPHDKQALAAWMLTGRRTFTRAEQLWASYSHLPPQDKERIREALSESL